MCVDQRSLTPLVLLLSSTRYTNLQGTKGDFALDYIQGTPSSTTLGGCQLLASRQCPLPPSHDSPDTIIHQPLILSALPLQCTAPSPRIPRLQILVIQWEQSSSAIRTVIPPLPPTYPGSNRKLPLPDLTRTRAPCLILRRGPACSGRRSGPLHL